jgi:hypothetical protein
MDRITGDQFTDDKRRCLYSWCVTPASIGLDTIVCADNVSRAVVHGKRDAAIM